LTLPEIIAILLFAFVAVCICIGIYKQVTSKKRRFKFQDDLDKMITVEYGKYILPMTVREKIENWDNLSREGKRYFAIQFYKAKIEQGLVEVAPGQFVRKKDIKQVDND
jgi:hypothetical protein